MWDASFLCTERVTTCLRGLSNRLALLTFLDPRSYNLVTFATVLLKKPAWPTLSTVGADMLHKQVNPTSFQEKEIACEASTATAAHCVVFLLLYRSLGFGLEAAIWTRLTALEFKASACQVSPSAH